MISKINRTSRRKLHFGGTRRYPTVQHDEVRTDTFHPSAVTLSRIVRSPRTGNKLADFKNNIEGIARFINGIALQMGLTSGDAKVDEVIRELLRMGSVTVDQLLNIQQEDVTAAIDKHKALATELKGDNGVETAEKTLILWENIRQDSSEYGGTGNGAVGLGQYETNLGQISIGKTKFPTIKTVVNTVENINIFLENLFNDPEQISTMDRVELNMKELDQSWSSFLEVIQIKDSLVKIDFTPKFLDPYISVCKSQEKYKSNNLLLTAPKINEVSPNVQTLKNSVPIFKKAEVPFSHLKDIVTIRNSGPTQPLVHVAGFPNGVEDLAKLKTDVSEEWLRNAINGTERVSERLLKAFEPIGNFTTGLEAVEKTLKASEGSEAVQKMEKTFEEVQWLGNLPDITATLNNATCDGNAAPIDKKNIEDVVTMMNELHTTVQGFVLEKEWSKFKESLSPLMTKIKLEGTADKNKVRQKVTELQKEEIVKTGKTEFGELFKVLDNFKEFLKKSTLADDIKGKHSDVDSFMKGVELSAYNTFLDCLRDNVGSGGEAMKQVLEKTQNLRTHLPSNEMAFDEVKALLDSREDIRKVKKSGEAMKGVKSEEMEKVTAAMGKGKLGVLMEMVKAVRGMDTILKLDEMRENELKPLTEDLTFIVDQSEKWSLPKEDVDRLKAFGTVKTTLSGMYAEIDKVTGSVKLNPKNLKDLGQAFEEAAKMKAVTLDTKTLIESLEKLEKAMKNGPIGKGVQKRAANNLSGVISALKSLEPLSLDFTGYNFKSATNALTSLNTFFVSYDPSANTNSGGGSQSALSPSAVAPSAITTSVPLVESPDQTLVYVGCALAAFVIIGVGVGAVVYIKKRKPAHDQENPAPIDSNTNTKDSGESKDSAAKDEKKGTEKKNDSGEEKAKKDEPPTPNPPAAPAPAPEQVHDPEPVEPPKQENKTAPAPVVAVSDDNVPEEAVFLMVTVACAGIRDAMSKKVVPDPQEWFKALLAVCNKATNYLQIMEGVNERESRFAAIDCKSDTMAKIEGFKNNFINANQMQFGELTWILSQAPLDGTERREKNVPKVDTREKHWAMIFQNNVAICVQLCNFEEGNPKEVKCSHYYPEKIGEEKSFGRYKLKLVGEKNVKDQFSEEVSLLKFECTDTDKKETKTVDILRYFGWPDHGAPASPLISLDIIKFTDAYNKNVLVHCSAGVGRTGTLAAIKVGIDMCKELRLNDVVAIIQYIRDIRSTGIQACNQIPYLILAVTLYFMIKQGIDFNDAYSEMLFYHLHLEKTDSTSESARDKFIADQRKKAIEKKEKGKGKDTKKDTKGTKSSKNTKNSKKSSKETKKSKKSKKEEKTDEKKGK